jgi:type IV pilus assembly protein PilC
MAEFVLKYADGRGQIHQQVASAASEKELRERYSQQGFLIYSIKSRTLAAPTFTRRKKLDLEKFLIFNQQFVTLIRAADSEITRPSGRASDGCQAGSLR